VVNGKVKKMLLNPVKLKVLAVFQRGAVTIHDYLFNYLWKNHGIQLDCRAIEQIKTSDLAEYDLVLNAICADAWHKDRITKLELWCKVHQKRFINGIEGLTNCNRRNAYKIWSKNNVNCARVERIPKKSLALKLNMPFPAIFRHENTHLGSSMKLVRNIKDVENIDESYFKKSTVAIEFKDYKSHDGFYRKYRCLLLGDEVIARHHISSPDWNIHADSRQADRIATHIEEDLTFCSRPLHEKDELLRAKNLLKLDYTIADYTLLEDGKPFYFEMNPCFNLITLRTFKREWSYQLHATHRYCEAYAAFLFDDIQTEPANFINTPVIL
jgi:hypothetical protein